MTGKQKISGHRVDSLLKGIFPQCLNRHVDEAISLGWITDHQGRPVKKGDRALGPESLNIRALTNQLEVVSLGNPNLIVPVESDHESFCVVDKPAGLPCHPHSLLETETVTHWAFAQFPSCMQVSKEAQPTITPHRLDTGTTGLLVVAKTAKAFEDWRQAFHEKLIEKEYLAWCWGVPRHAAFDIEVALVHSRKDPHKMHPCYRPGTGLPALSHCELLTADSLRQISLIRVRSNTGVMHQVRAHLALAGYPLIGDRYYDQGHEARPLKTEWHLLRASKLKTPWGTFQVSDESLKNPFGPN